MSPLYSTQNLPGLKKKLAYSFGQYPEMRIKSLSLLLSLEGVDCIFDLPISQIKYYSLRKTDDFTNIAEIKMFQ